MQIAPQWMKLDTNILNHNKVRKIRRMPEGDSIFTLWIYLMCEGMRNMTNPGAIEFSSGIPATLDDIAEDVRIKLPTVQMGIDIFVKLGMIFPNENGCIEVKNIRKHQAIDELEYKRHLNKERVKRFRDKQKLALIEDNSNSVMHYSNDVNDTYRVEKSREEKNIIDIDKVIEKQPIKIPSSKKPLNKKKKTYGTHNNVLLTTKEYKNLMGKYDESLLTKYIEDLSWGIATKSYKYTDHNLTIQNWIRRNEKPTKPQKTTHDYVDNYPSLRPYLKKAIKLVDKLCPKEADKHSWISENHDMIIESVK